MYYNQIQIERAKNQGIFSVRITDFGLKGLRKIIRRNQKAEGEINKLIEGLKSTPEMGRELTSDLYGMRAVSSKDMEFRIVYGMDESDRQVTVHAVGHRRNVYQNLARFLKKVMPYSRKGRLK